MEKFKTEYKDFGKTAFWKNMERNRGQRNDTQKCTKDGEHGSTGKDVEDARKKIKLRKAADTNGIIGEFLAYGGEELKRGTQNSLSGNYGEKRSTQDWRKSRVNLYTKEVGNRRTILKYIGP